MKKSRFTDSQILAVLKQAEAGTAVPALCREHGISTATFYKWRSKFGGMDASLMGRMKELEDENRRLKKLYIEAQLKADIVAEVITRGSLMKILLATAFLMLVISAPFGATAASAATVPGLTTCSLKTFKGTVTGASTLRASTGQPTFSWLWMEHWDGAGNATWIEMDNYGTFNTGWFSGANKYSIGQNCVATDAYRYGSFTYFVNPDGSGLSWVRPLFDGTVEGSSAQKISSVSLPTLAASTVVCSKRTLSGTYVTSEVLNRGATLAGFFARTSYGADGTYTYREETGNGAGTVKRTGTGTYTVAANCIATLYEDGAVSPAYAAVVAPNGNEYWWMNIKNDGTYATSKATRVSQSLVDNSATSLP